MFSVCFEIKSHSGNSSSHDLYDPTLSCNLCVPCARYFAFYFWIDHKFIALQCNACFTPVSF